ncbi:hypothetical protein [Sphingomonas pituitosa]|uniref:hypothetical protein n=1 Tax=Sphingomonas pituitosa TaxID=99597 RepID=UPI0008368F82|nr:hypothetical protein [Sphingomonas pituitosa]
MSRRLNDTEVEWLAMTARAMKAIRNVAGSGGAGLSQEVAQTIRLIANDLHNVSAMGLGDRTFEILHPPERLAELKTLLDQLEEQFIRTMVRPRSTMRRPSMISRLRASLSR